MEDQGLQKLSSMTLEQKIGQLIIGEANTDQMTPEYEEYIRKYQIGGYKIAGISIKNREQVKAFLEDIKAVYRRTGAEIEPILACDQECGTLSVFGNLVTEFPGNMALGAAADPELAYLQGNVSGYELSQLGINMAFAPVADINLQANNPVIGVRSFGDDPQKVSALCGKYASGLNDGGVAGCAKHFPGHGNTNVDSHLALPANYADMETFSRTELIPFTRLAAANVDAIMVSHVLYPNITGDRTPASLSEKIIHRLLRKELNYQGVIITDDLQMKAIMSNYTMEQAVRLFIQAGGDLVLINADRGLEIEAFESLLSAVQEGIIPISRVDEAVARILALKNKIFTYGKERKRIAGNPGQLSSEISRKAVTLVRDPQKILPLKPGSKILLIAPEQINLTPADSSEGMENHLLQFIRQYCPGAVQYKTNLNQKTDRTELLALAKECDLIVQCTVNCNRFPEQTEIMELLSSQKPVLAIMVRDPYDVALIPQEVGVVAAYSAIDSNMAVTCDLIFGKGDFQGRLPVSLNS